MARNGVIGREGGLPWHLPEDLRRFREITTGHTLVMGRKTWEGIGRPLPDRRTIVVTRQAGFAPCGAEVAPSLEEAFAMARGESELFICGGGEIYRQAIHLAGRIYLTVIDLDAEGEVFFPRIPDGLFVESSRERLCGSPGGVFLVLERLLTGEGAAANVPPCKA